ncbi:MAG: hypothetical protein WC284_16820 [Candidimonas sp.]
MSAKKFGSTILNDSYYCIAEGKSDFDSTVTVVFSNHSSDQSEIFLAYSKTAPTDSDHLIYGESLGGNSHMEFKGIALEEGHKLFVRSCGPQKVSAVAYGFETKIIKVGC